MNKRNLWVGLFITAGLGLFAAGLFLIGNQHKAFHHHTEFYTGFANVDGILKGAKVRVDGMDGGQVEAIEIPARPSQKFRIKLQVDDRLHGLIRDNSIVTIESEGIVGDKFLMIHEGTDQAPVAASRSTLRSKEPFEIGKMLEQASGLIKQANGTIVDVNQKLDGALQAVTATVNNTNGVVTDIRRGRGTAGLLLEDQQTAANVKQIVVNGRQATEHLDTASVQVNDLLTDFQSRHLSDQAQQLMTKANSATDQLNQASVQVNRTLTEAFAEDQYGETAGGNLQQSLTSINQATGNLAEDTAALKQEFFFKGFFKKRGYDDLDHLPVQQYRQGQLFPKSTPHREWLAASSLFTKDANGREILAPAGREQIDQAFGRLPDPYTDPILIEGYAQSGTAPEQLIQSRARAALLRSYLEVHFHLYAKNVGVVALQGTPPSNVGQSTWDGVCLVQLSPLKK